MDPSFRLTASRKTLSGVAAPGRLPPRNGVKPSSAEVMKIVYCQTTGVAALQLGNFARHRMFWDIVQVTGSSRAAAALPFELGPRHCGQFAQSVPASTPAAKTTAPTRANTFRCVIHH